MTNFQNLIDLSSTTGEDVPDLGGSTGLAEALKDALDKQRKEKQEAAALEILEVLRRVDTHKSTVRRNIKNLRRTMKGHTDSLDELDRCLEYGKATSNFLPVMNRLGLVNYHSTGLDYEEFQRLATVPDDFKPEE